ncbi:MAG: hypothetical protein R6W77_02390 [Trueperaceae bacterium]
MHHVGEELVSYNRLDSENLGVRFQSQTEQIFLETTNIPEVSLDAILGFEVWGDECALAALPHNEAVIFQSLKGLPYGHSADAVSAG